MDMVDCLKNTTHARAEEEAWHKKVGNISGALHPKCQKKWEVFLGGGGGGVYSPLKGFGKRACPLAFLGIFVVSGPWKSNRSVACKDLGMQLEIIACDVTTWCSGCLH